MSEISLALIPPQKLSGEVRKVPFVRDNEKCMDLVFEALNYHGDVHSQPMYKGNLNRPRGKPSLFVVEDGKNVRNTSGRRLYAIEGEKTKVWHVPVEDHSKQPVVTHLTTPFAHQSVSLVTYGNFLFLFGVDSRNFSPVTMRYDGNSDTWINLAPIPRTAAVGSAVARVGDHIIVAGGITVHRDSLYLDTNRQHNLTSEVYKYDIGKDAWNTCADYPLKFVAAGACEFNGLMYIAGGETLFQTNIGIRAADTDKVYAYDIQRDVWLRKPSLPSEWSHVCLAAVDNKLYAFGGWLSLIASLTEDAESWSSRDVNEDETIDSGDQLCAIHGDTVLILGGDEDSKSVVYELHEGVIERRSERLSIDNRTQISDCAILTLKQ